MKRNGFTLIEVMVALAIVGLALPALLFQVMTNVDGEAYLRDKAIAHWVAENQLARNQLNRSMGLGVLRGSATGTETMAGAQWQWRTQSMPTAVAGMRRLEISVGHEGHQPVVTLVGYVHE